MCNVWCCIVAGSRAGVVRMLGCVSASSGGVKTKVDGMCGASKVCLYISNLIAVMMKRSISRTSSATMMNHMLT